MPLETDRPGDINAALMAAIPQQTPAATAPAITALQDAFYRGIISLDDINQRWANKPVLASARATELQAQDLKRRQIGAENELFPEQLQAAHENLAQGVKTRQLNDILTQLQTDKAQEQLTYQTAPLEEKTKLAEAELGDRVRSQYPIMTGQLVPRTIEVPNPNPVTYSDWFNQNVMPDIIGEANKQPFDGSPDEVAALRNSYIQDRVRELKDSPVAHDDFAKFQDKNATVTIRDTPDTHREFTQALLAQAAQLGASAQLNQLQQAINLKYFGAKAEAQGKSEGEMLGGKPQTETEIKLANLVHQSKPIEQLREAWGSYARLVNTAQDPNPNNNTDRSLLFSLVQIENPGAVVRGQELEALQQGRAKIALAHTLWSKIINDPNSFFTPRERAQLVQTARDSVIGREKSTLPELKRIQNGILGAGVDPTNNAVLNDSERSLLKGVSPVVSGSLIGSESEAGTAIQSPGVTPENPYLWTPGTPVPPGVKYLKNSVTGKTYFSK